MIESSFGKTGKFKIHFPDGGQKDVQGGIVMKYKTFMYGDRKSVFIQ